MDIADFYRFVQQEEIKEHSRFSIMLIELSRHKVSFRTV